jgi:hypothetical protein
MDVHLGKLGMHLDIVASLKHWLVLHLYTTISNLLFEFFEGLLNVIVGGGCGW